MTHVTQSYWMLLSHQRSWSNHIRALGNQDQTRCLQAPLHDTEPQKVKKLFLHYFIGFPLFCALLSSPVSWNILPWGLKENKRSCANFTSCHGCSKQHVRSGQGLPQTHSLAQQPHCQPKWQFDTSQRGLFAALIRQSAD